MKLLYVTTNSGKVESLARDLGPCGVEVIQVPKRLVEPQSTSPQEVAEAKCLQAFREMDSEPVVVLDAGFSVKALNDFPGALVEPILKTLGIGGILKLMREEVDRKCAFCECLAYMDDTLDGPKLFISYIHGSLAEQPRGQVQPHHWSELSLVFVPQGGDGRTLAETTREEHHEWRDKSRRDESSTAKQFTDWFVRERGLSS